MIKDKLKHIYVYEIVPFFVIFLIFIASVLFMVLAPELLYAKYNLFFTSILSISSLIYMILTYMLLIENRRLFVDQQKNIDYIKRKEIISIIYAYFTKCSDLDLKHPNELFFLNEDWNYLKLKLLPHLYLFDANTSTLLIKIFVEDKIKKAQSIKHYIIDKNNLKYTELMKYIMKNFNE